MCLVLFSWQRCDAFPLVVAANRDERFDRSAHPIAFWDDQPHIAGGRDLVAGGTWLAIARNGRFGIITNFRDPTVASGQSSRGELIPLWLSSDDSAQQFQTRLEKSEANYAGYNLLFGDRHELHYFSNRSLSSGALRPGHYALSNAEIDADWPKMRSGREFIEKRVNNNDISPQAFEPFLTDTTQAPDSELPQPFFELELRRVLSAPFIIGDTYGTRCSTVMTISTHGAVRMHEQHYAPLGRPAESHELSFQLD